MPGGFSKLLGPDCELSEDIDICEMAAKIRVRIMAKITDAMCCLDPMTPIQVGDEQISYSAYMKMLQELYKWTYDACNLADGVGDPEVIINSAFLECHNECL